MFDFQNETRHFVATIHLNKPPPSFCPLLGQNGTLLSDFWNDGTLLGREKPQNNFVSSQNNSVLSQNHRELSQSNSVLSQNNSVLPESL